MPITVSGGMSIAGGLSTLDAPALSLDFMSGTLDSRITFSRGSQATMVDNTGRLTYAPNNILTYSEQFDNTAWTKTNAIVSANSTTAPDGTITADKIIASATTDYHGVRQSINYVLNVRYVCSAYVKSAEYTNFLISDINSGTMAAAFNLETGEATLVSGGTFTSVSAGMVSVGNGWWRCYVTGISNVSSSRTPTFIGYPAGATLNFNGAQYTGDGASGVFIWGTQLEAVTYQTTPGTYNSTTVKNLLGYSEDFGNAAWTKVASSITPNIIANPINGAVNAQKLVEDTATSQHYYNIASSLTLADNGIYTQSVYAKAAERSFIRLECRRKDSTFARADFNLSTGAITNAVNTVSTSVVSVGNGWWRCSITWNALTGAGSPFPAYILYNGSSTTYAGDGTSGVYVWGAQFSDSASLDPYVNNPLAAPAPGAYYGPRFDYGPISLQPNGLLAEGQRTNLILYSEQLDNGNWVKSRSSITTNSIISPDGTLTADKIVESTDTGTHRIYQQVAKAASSLTRTYSVYLKAGERTNARIQVTDNVEAVQCFAVVDLSTGTVGVPSVSGGTSISSPSASIVNAGNGWYRCILTATFDATITNPGFWISLLDSSGVSSYAGDGVSGFFAWGAQWEDGNRVTSYIPTVASTVTRSADTITMTGTNFSSWYNQGQGTFVVNYLSPANPDQDIFFVNAGNFQNSIGPYYQSSSVVLFARVSNVGQLTNTLIANLSQTSAVKLAIAYATNDYASCGNGGTIQTNSTSGSVPTVDRLSFVTLGVQGNPFNGYYRSFEYYNTRIANSQLQGMSRV